jgi:prepilin-type processing-associated H-X9-DG protein
LPEGQQHHGIREGALWPYVEDLRIYRCPNGYTGERLNYGISDGMNGLSRTGTTSWVDGKVQGVRVGDTVVWVQNLSEIISPGPGQRMVFIDRGWIAPDSYSTHYRWEAWWDDPPVRHNDGATISFADGHAEHWQWKGADTVEHGRRSDRGHFSNNYAPQTAEGREDLHRLQRAVWGRLGYEPTH